MGLEANHILAVNKLAKLPLPPHQLSRAILAGKGAQLNSREINYQTVDEIGEVLAGLDYVNNCFNLFNNEADKKRGRHIKVVVNGEKFAGYFEQPLVLYDSTAYAKVFPDNEKIKKADQKILTNHNMWNVDPSPLHFNNLKVLLLAALNDEMIKTMFGTQLVRMNQYYTKR